MAGEVHRQETFDGIALSVVKKVEDPETQVDAVTGATLTSNGVSEMLQNCLKGVEKIEKVKSSISFEVTENDSIQ